MDEQPSWLILAKTLYLLLLNFCFVGIRLSDQIKDDVQKASVAEFPKINVLIEHMSSYIINSRSDNTAKSYYYSFNRWSTFAKKHSFDVLPAQPEHIAQNHSKISYNQQIIITQVHITKF
jgi:hypothetical protein